MALRKIAQTKDIPEGQIRPFEIEGKKIAIAHLGKEFFAIDDVCTHAQCSLGEGAILDSEVECPCHGSRFDVKTGQVRFLPAVVPIKSYKTKLEGEDILVEI